MKNKFFKMSMLVMSAIPLSSCSNQNPSEDGVLIKELSPQFILKTELSSNRSLIESREGTLHNYLGVFPINYEPVKQEKITDDDLSKLNPYEYKSYDITFDFALNGAVFRPNDHVIYSYDVITHPDQVRVVISRNINDVIHPKTEEEIVKGEYQPAMSKELNMDCYSLIDERYSNEDVIRKIYFCKFKNKNTPSVVFQVLGPDNTSLLANYNLEKWGINVRWKINKKNRKDLESIHKHVLHLLNVWNVSPKI